MKEQRYICFENSEMLNHQNRKKMKEKIIFVIVCIIAFFTLCALIDRPFAEVPNDPDGECWPMCLAFALLVTMVLAPVFKPIGMFACLIIGTVVAILCGMLAFFAYVVCAIAIVTTVKFNPEVRDMICNLWSAEDNEK